MVITCRALTLLTSYFQIVFRAFSSAISPYALPSGYESCTKNNARLPYIPIFREESGLLNDYDIISMDYRLLCNASPTDYRLWVIDISHKQEDCCSRIRSRIMDYGLRIWDYGSDYILDKGICQQNRYLIAKLTNKRLTITLFPILQIFASSDFLI